MRTQFRPAILFFILLLFYSQAIAQQTAEDAYLSIERKCRLYLPTVGISMHKLPAYTGFNADMSDEISSFTDFEKKSISYFFDEKVLEYMPVKIRLSHPHTSENAMEITILMLDESMNIHKLYDNYKNASLLQLILPELKTKLGKAYGFRMSQNGDIVDIYFLQYNNLYYFFQYNAQNTESCHSIIKSIRSTKFKQEVFDAYQQHLAKVKKQQHQEKPRKLNDYQGKFGLPAIVSAPNLGVKMGIPEGFNYEYKSAPTPSVTLGKVLEDRVNLDRKDLENQSILFFNFNKQGLYAMYRLWNNMGSTKERIDADVKTQKALKKFQLNVDGIIFDAASIGHEEFPTINAYAQLNGFGIALMFMNVEKDKLPIVEQLLNGLKFGDEHKINVTIKKISPISQQLAIKERSINQLPQINFTKSPIIEDVVKYTLTDLRVSFLLPKGIELINPENVAKTISNTDITLEGNLTNSKFISVSSSSQNYTTNISVTITKKEEGITIEKLMDGVVKNWSTYNHVEVIRSGIGIVNGQAWGLMETQQSGYTIPLFFTLHNDLQIMITGRSQNREDLKLFESLLYYVEFN